MSSWNGMPVDHVYFEVVSQCSFGMFAFSYLHQVFSVILVKIFPQQTSLHHTRAINLNPESESTKSIKELPSGNYNFSHRNANFQLRTCICVSEYARFRKSSKVLDIGSLLNL
uniref:Uncharacterized protein n=1 Tax=Glossina palpalis gambiensis TaxID=67801 RepID=A0A1B0BC27_9MUSC